MLAPVLNPAKNQRGFSLVEMVTVIIILGILSLGVTGFIAFGTRIFLDSTSVERVLNESRFALERMTRDIRNAAPNSLRVRHDSGFQCLELVPIQAATNYLSMPIYPDASANLGQTIVAPMPISTQMMALIYPLVASDVYANPDDSTGKLFSLTSVETASSITTLTFKGNVQFAEASPRQRLFLVSQPVSYCFVQSGSDVNLLYFSDYGINNPTQLSPAAMETVGTPGVLMAQGITNNLASDAPISIEPATLVNNAMVLLTPEFEAVGQRFRYQQQVQVINVP